jgi:hypothetical protein
MILQLARTAGLGGAPVTIAILSLVVPQRLDLLVIQGYFAGAHTKACGTICLSATVRDGSADVPIEDEVPSLLEVIHALGGLCDEDKVAHLQAELQADTKAQYSNG